MTTDWGIPDWRDPAAYGDTSQWSKDRWRWEFTRRREDYRADFLENFKATLKLFEDQPEALKIYQELPEDREKGRQPPEQGRLATVDAPGFRAIMPTNCFEKYRLPAMPNPAISEQPCDILCFEPKSIRSYPPKPEKALDFVFKRREFAMKAGELPIFFDLSAPLNHQLEVARKMLLLEQQKYIGKVLQPRKHPAKWLMYLRVLDAREAGASWSAITKANVLGHRQDLLAARDAWAAARALCFNWPD